jgi:hypothetical protein
MTAISSAFFTESSELSGTKQIAPISTELRTIHSHFDLMWVTPYFALLKQTQRPKRAEITHKAQRFKTIKL